jgi:bifunctional DNase/RNase
MMVDMKVSGLTIDPLTNMPILVLKDHEGRQAVPIWIGLIEASAIATELERIQLARPMTHDLMHNLLGCVGARVERVEVHDLRDKTFYASIVLLHPDGRSIAIDSRPSDAIALALRAEAPIRVAKKVIDRVRRIDMRDGLSGRGLGEGAGLSGPEGRGGNGHAKAVGEGRPNAAAGKAGRNADTPAREPPQDAQGEAEEPPPEDLCSDFLESLPDEDFPKWKM